MKPASSTFARPASLLTLSAVSAPQAGLSRQDTIAGPALTVHGIQAQTANAGTYCLRHQDCCVWRKVAAVSTIITCVQDPDLKISLASLSLCLKHMRTIKEQDQGFPDK